MNSHLTYRMAQIQQQDLHRAAERARAAHGFTGRTRLTALCQRLLSARSSRPELQQSPAPMAEVATRI